MAMTQLSMETLDKLDMGKVNAQFGRSVKRVVEDMMDRPADKTARTVAIELVLSPVSAEDGQLDHVRGEFRVRTKLPQHRTRVYEFKARKGGLLAFNDESPDDVNQMTLDQVKKG